MKSLLFFLIGFSFLVEINGCKKDNGSGSAESIFWKSVKTRPRVDEVYGEREERAETPQQ